MNQKLFFKAQFVILLVLGVCNMNAKLRVGAPLPNVSAMLDIESDSKGLLIPRIELANTTDNTTITNGNVESLLVYNIRIINDVRTEFLGVNVVRSDPSIASNDNATSNYSSFANGTGMNILGNVLAVPSWGQASVYDSTFSPDNNNQSIEAGIFWRGTWYEVLVLPRPTPANG